MGVTRFWGNDGKPLHERSEHCQVFKERGSESTTTSIPDSGLLDVLIPLFEKESGYIVRTINVGSAQAIVLGRRGEVDALLVHSPDAGKKPEDLGV